MDLRRKLHLLSLAYALSLAVGTGLSAWYITARFEPGFLAFQEEVAHAHQVEHALGLLRQMEELLRSSAHLDTVQGEYEQIDRALQAELAALPSPAMPRTFRERIGKSLQLVHDMGTRRLGAVGTAANGEAVLSEIDERTLDDLERLLFELGAAGSKSRQASFARASAAEQKMMVYLVVNTLLGFALCIAGLTCVRRWVTDPVSHLREATANYSRGAWSYRVRPERRDELGRLAEEMNRMAAEISSIQEEMIRRERQAAAGTLMQYVTHNIRTPLLGIRWLAEVLPVESDEHEAVGHRNAIVSTVDDLYGWIKAFQDTLAPGRDGGSPGTAAVGDVGGAPARLDSEHRRHGRHPGN